MNRLSYLLIFIITTAFVSASVAADARAGEIETFGKKISTEILKIGKKDGKTVLVHSGGEIKCTDVFSVKFVESVTVREGTPAAEVILINGDRFKGELMGSEGESAIIETEVMGNVSISYDGIKAVFFPPNIHTHYATYLRNRLKKPAVESDTIYLKSGRNIKGTILKLNRNSLVVEDSISGTSLDIDYQKTSGLRLSMLAKVKPFEGLWALCYMTDGCVLSGKVETYSSGELVMATRLTGKLAIPASRIARLIFRGGHYSFLSDMKPVEMKEIPYIGTPGGRPAHFYSMRNDRTAVGGRTLSIRGRKFQKGLGMSARTESTWNLDGKYSEFKAVIGLDDEGSKGLGLVDFIVMVDGKEAFRKEKVTMKDDPLPVTVDLKGKKTITLIAAFHVDGKDVPPEKRKDSGPAENWAVWGNAIVRK